MIIASIAFLSILTISNAFHRPSFLRPPSFPPSLSPSSSLRHPSRGRLSAGVYEDEVQIVDSLLGEAIVDTFDKLRRSVHLDQMKDTLSVELQNHLSFFSPVAGLQKLIHSIPQMWKVISQFHWFVLVDLAVVFFITQNYKRALLFVFHKLNSLRGDKAVPYSESLLGYLDRPISYAVYYLPFLYSLDFITLFIHTLGIDYYIKVL